VRLSCVLLQCAAVLALLSCGNAQRHSFRPDEVPFSPDKLKLLKVPAGFEVTAWATGLGNVRMIAVGADGTVYVTMYDESDVLAFKDVQGRGEQQKTVARLDHVHGIAIKDGTMYLATVHDLYTAPIQKDGSLGATKKILSSFGDGGQHPRRTLGFGPDGMLYVSIGSTCNACNDQRDEKAVIWKLKPDGSGREVYSRGLRNTIGFDWHPETHELWGMDNGTDWLGDDRPREELNKLVQNGDYGWPFCVENKEVDPTYAAKPPQGTKEQFCTKTIGPELSYTAHAAPIQFIFYAASMFPNDYKGDAFVAMHGSWNRRPASGFNVLRIKFDHGKPVRIEDFLSGFLMPGGREVFGRSAGVAVTQDGALLVSDDTSGVIYRIAYKGTH